MIEGIPPPWMVRFETNIGQMFSADNKLRRGREHEKNQIDISFGERDLEC